MKKADESASEPEKNGKSRSRRRNERRYRGKRKKLNQEKGEGLECPVCKKNIRDISAAIIDVESGKPSHFDCILKKISEKENIGKQEKVIYLGSGNFGIVKILNNKKFEIIKQIPYEKLDDGDEWRRSKRFTFPDK